MSRRAIGTSDHSTLCVAPRGNAAAGSSDGIRPVLRAPSPEGKTADVFRRLIGQS